MANTKVVELKEFQTLSLSEGEISREVSEILISKFKKQIQVFPPWFGNNNQWQITSQGWVGFIPVNRVLGFALIPKIPLTNLFGMLSYAYKLRNIVFLDGEYHVTTLQEFYDYLAEELSKFILDRSRKGLFREYLSKNSQLPFVRGRINLRKVINSPWDVYIDNYYQEHTADVEFNQILTYTLDIISRSRLCSLRVMPIIRTAYRTIAKYSRPLPFTPQESISFLYNRLNQDYRPMHTLCSFFIEHVGPQIYIGGHAMLPFMVDMTGLFEMFVFEWLKSKLPKEYILTSQEKFFLSDNDEIFFKADIVINEKDSGKVKFVLDTKYKDKLSPDTADIAQVIAYAQTKGAKEAILIYPIKLAKPFIVKSGDINVRCLSFCIEKDLDEAGNIFLQDLLGST